MRKLQRTLVQLFLLCLAAIGLSACGGDDDFSNFDNIVNQSRLAFVGLSSNIEQGQALPDFQVQLFDGNGNLVSGANGQVVLTLADNPTGGTLTLNGTSVSSVTANGNDGVAVFSGVSINNEGSGYTLRATITEPTTGRSLSQVSDPITVTAATPVGPTNAVYLRSTEDLWDNEDDNSELHPNVVAMDTVFGAGNWTAANFETVNLTTLFQPNQFIYMDGSDDGSEVLAQFLSDHRSTLESWIQSGGRSLLNAAPNIGGSFDLAFGIRCDYEQGVNPDEVVVDISHPIGTACNGTLNFEAGSFSHAPLTGELLPIITGTDDPGNPVVLGELNPNLGRILFGTMTTTKFHSPEPNAQILRENILRYAAGLPLVTAGEPEIGIARRLRSRSHH